MPEQENSYFTTLSSRYQPIVEIDGTGEPVVVGIECLTRSEHSSSTDSATALFHRARMRGEEVELDRACIRRFMSELRGYRGEHFITMNVHASTLAQAGFVSFLLDTAGAEGFRLSRLVFELLERRISEEMAPFASNAVLLRQKGVRIALDDVGIGGSNFQAMLDVAPEILKLDRYLIHEIDDSRRIALLDAIVSLRTSFECEIVAEGVERSEQSELLLAKDIRLQQGFLFGRPAHLTEMLEIFANPAPSGR